MAQRAGLRTLGLLRVVLLTGLGLAERCGPPAGADTSVAPPFWCGLHANVTLGAGCGAEVTETLRVPWAAGTMARVLLKAPAQSVTRVSLHALHARGARGAAVPHLLRTGRAGLTATVEFRPARPRAAPAAFELRYALAPGALFWVPCPGDAPPAPGKRGARAAVWRPGGLSAREFRAVGATFVFPDAAAAAAAEVAVRPPALGAPVRRGAAVTAGGGRAPAPESAAFVARWAGAPCAQARDCAAEARAAKLVLSRRAKGSAAEVGVAAAALALLALFAAGAVFMCWRARRRGKSAGAAAAAAGGGDGPASEDAAEDLPDGFRHFAYDTDDPDSGKMWRAGEADLATSVERMESVFVKDITPAGAASAAD